MRSEWVLKEFIVETPTLVACTVGLVVALVYRARRPLSCILSVAGLASLLLLTVTTPLVQMHLVHLAMDGDVETYRERSYVLGLGCGVLRAVGLGLLIAAAFVGWRRRPAVRK